ncbi:MAG: bifunctional UDP-N-acetylmuramoyl-tripeptide:D-alanyl-D-alanine ligase/alanine racemase [Muribaculaceae bacterium]|nr:bifunctional UDP-N-acetylmuramoyl-tripeptide:D-alanyl-D-alanine ligase/alanine racemase [Muribaculaceae bacterium]
MKTTIGELAARLGLSVPEGKENWPVLILLTDSRSLTEPEESLFFAIPSATTDATRFMRPLYERGVRCFVAPEVPEDMAGVDDAVVLVHPDPVAALQRIASRRGKSGGEVVAITGSKGKTTLKEWIYQLLGRDRRIARSPRSYNSQIGVPLSMWEIGRDTDLSLIEAGVSKEGEMATLAACIRPDTVIVTDIDDVEHAEGFRSRRGKVEEKMSLAATPGVRRVIYCEDDPEIARAARNLPATVERAGWSAEGNPEAVLQLNPEEDIPTRFVTEADRRNALHALAFLMAEGYDKVEAARLFSRVHPIATRLSVADGEAGCSIIYDSYTSDFSSLAPAVDFLMRRRTPEQQTVVILSDLMHGNPGNTDEYAEVARLMRRRGVDRVIGVGEAISARREMFGEDDIFFLTPGELTEYLRSHPLRRACVLIKGSPENDFTHLRELLEVRTHETVLEVNLDALIRNYNYFRSFLPPQTGMVAMVKASGYGAGSYEIAKTLQDAGAAYLAVAVLDEGLDLRRQGITMPIMVMNPRVADYEEMFSNRLEPEIYTMSMLADVMTQAEIHGVRDYPIHVKLDTGMHRMGFVEDELPSLMKILVGQDRVRISSVFSHLATADMPDMNEYTEMQLATFERCSHYMLEQCPYHFRRHVLNSAGILRFPRYHYDMVRLGIGLYGVNTLPPEMEKPLDTVSTLKTVIINLRDWKAGTSIGYARRGMLKRDSRIATIPIGYADGMNRHFGNGAVRVLVNGHEAPTIGNICMDACMIDVTGIDCREGDTVEIFGENMPISRLSDTLDTIPYEILTSVSPRVKRVYYRE